MMLFLILAGLLVGIGRAQTLQQDMQRISEGFEKLPPAQQIAQQWKDPQGAQIWIELIRINARSALESEVQPRYAKGKERRTFQKAQKDAERAEQKCIRLLERIGRAN
jgi:hypothetical protein